MKRILSLVVILALLFTVAACAANDTTPGQTTSSNDNATQDSSTQDTASDTDTPAQTGALLSTTNWYEPYSETITISTVLRDGGGTIFHDGDDITSNIWTRDFKDNLNIEIVVDWVVPDSEYFTRISLAMASQELPDVFQCSPNQFHQLTDANWPTDITDTLAYASDNIHEYLEAQQAITDTCMRDGRLYAMPELNWGFLPSPAYVWLRKDWMEDHGLSGPNTMDELLEIAGIFMDAGADFGMAIERTLDYLYILAPGWHAYPTIWIDDGSGNIIYGATAPEMKNALRDWSDWYKEGIFRPDFAALDYDAMNQDVINSRVGIHPFWQWWGWGVGINVIETNGFDTYFEPWEIPSVDGRPIMAPIKFENSNYTVVNRDYAHPEALIKLISRHDYVSTGDGILDGIMTVDDLREYSEGDRVHCTGPFRIIPPIMEDRAYAEILHVRAMGGGVEDFLDPQAAARFQDAMDFLAGTASSGVGNWLQTTGDRCAYMIATKLLENNQIIRDKMWGPPPETVARYGDTLDDILKEGFTQIIMGVEDIDYFETIVANWYAAGGDQSTATVNELFG